MSFNETVMNFINSQLENGTKIGQYYIGHYNLRYSC